MRLPFTCAAALLLTVCLLCRGTAFGQLRPSQRRALDSLLRSQTASLAPGLGIGIVSDGQTVYEGYVGYANLEHRVPATDSTRWNIASNAKQFTAFVVLQLVRAGRLQLDDSLARYLPWWRPNEPEPVRIRHLLAHRSGIRDVYDLWALQGVTWWQRFLGNDDAVALLQRQSSLDFRPGTDYQYSNSNYLLLTEVVRAVTGRPFAAVADSCFRQLGMPATAFATNHAAVIPNKARPYGNWGGWREYPWLSDLHGDGALFTTLPDQLTWERALQQAPAESALALSQQALPGDTLPPYGFGLMFGTRGTAPITYHDGSTGAYNASFLRIPQQRLAVVVVSNHGGVSTSQTARAAADILLGPAPAPAAALPPEPGANVPANACTGVYRTSAGSLIRIYLQHDTLFRAIAGRPAVALIRERGSLYRYASNPQLRIHFTADGRFTIYFPGQEPITGVPLPPLASGSALQPGRYRDTETGAELQLAPRDNASDNHLAARLNGSDLRTDALRPDLLVGPNYEIQGLPNGTLRLRGGRLRNVNFVPQ